MAVHMPSFSSKAGMEEKLYHRMVTTIDRGTKMATVAVATLDADAL